MGFFNRLSVELQKSRQSRSTLSRGPVTIGHKSITINGQSAESINKLMEAQNDFVKQWSANLRIALKRSAQSASDKGKKVDPYRYQSSSRTEKKLYRSIRVKYKKKYGEIEGVGFAFERHGVFLQKGVGRGYQMAGNTAIRVSKSGQVTVRPPKDWFNKLIGKHAHKLADGLAAINADIAVNATNILIK